MQNKCFWIPSYSFLQVCKEFCFMIVKQAYLYLQQNSMPPVAVYNVPTHTAFIIKSQLFLLKASFQRWGRGKGSQKGLEIQFTKTIEEKNGEHI